MRTKTLIWFCWGYVVFLSNAWKKVGPQDDGEVCHCYNMLPQSCCQSLYSVRVPGENTSNFKFCLYLKATSESGEESDKVVKSAVKSLTKLKAKLEAALAEAVNQGEELEIQLNRTSSNKEEVVFFKVLIKQSDSVCPV